MQGRSALRRQRAYGAVVMIAGAIWTAAGVVIVGGPAWVPVARVYETAVPAATALLLLGLPGVKHRLLGRRQAPSWRAGFAAMWRRLDNVLDTGYDHQRGRGLRDVGSTSTAARIGILSARAGCAFTVAASLHLATADGSLAGRPMLWFGWFLLYAGVAGLGVAVITTEELPRALGASLLVGSLPVLQAATMVGTGMAMAEESFGPLVAVTLSTPLRVTAAMLLWLVLGVAWIWLGRALWTEPA